MRIRQRHLPGQHVLQRTLFHDSFSGGLTVEFGAVS
jgi:hypothetical protein